MSKTFEKTRTTPTNGAKTPVLGPCVHIFWRQLRYRKCWSCWARWRRKVRRLSKSEVHMQQKKMKRNHFAVSYSGEFSPSMHIDEFWSFSRKSKRKLCNILHTNSSARAWVPNERVREVGLQLLVDTITRYSTVEGYESIVRLRGLELMGSSMSFMYYL